MKQKLIAVCMILIFALFTASAELAELPMDSFVALTQPDNSLYQLNKDGTGTYSDESITVTVTREVKTYVEAGLTYNTTYWTADIVIADPCQLRTNIAGDINGVRTSRMGTMSKHSGAVVAVNGDYYGMMNDTYCVRQGQVLRKYGGAQLDTLIIDYNGDFHIFRANEKDAGIEEYKNDTYQCFMFGPALIIDGEINYDYSNALHTMAINNMNPRTAIGQVGSLHYVLCMVEGRNGNSCGAFGSQVAEHMFEKGCVQAYNLDGGASSMMYFGGKICTPIVDTGERTINDIVYFASAVK